MSQMDDAPITVKDDQGVEMRVSPVGLADFGKLGRDFQSQMVNETAKPYLDSLPIAERVEVLHGLLARTLQHEEVFEKCKSLDGMPRLAYCSLVKMDPTLKLEDVSRRFGPEALTDLFLKILTISGMGPSEEDGGADPPTLTGTTSLDALPDSTASPSTP